MVGTVIPIVHGERKNGRMPIALWLHGIGYICGAATLGLSLGIVGAAVKLSGLHLTRPSILIVSGLIASLYSLREASILSIPCPQLYSQVPQTWRGTMRPNVAVLCYGFGLGFGIGIRIPVSTFYVPMIWALCTGRPMLGALVFSAFGAGRAAPVLVAAKQFCSFSECQALVRGLVRWTPMLHIINGLVLALAGSYLLFAGFAGR
jgi:hypothetical protein